jgi:hypothetical protein
MGPLSGFGISTDGADASPPTNVPYRITTRKLQDISRLGAEESGTEVWAKRQAGATARRSPSVRIGGT